MAVSHLADRSRLPGPRFVGVPPGRDARRRSL